jgi:hypothetical protein
MAVEHLAVNLLWLAILGYLLGGISGIAFFRKERTANAFTFGSATVASLFGLISAVVFLTQGAGAGGSHAELFPSSIPLHPFSITSIL